jgi:hypothetical protein
LINARFAFIFLPLIALLMWLGLRNHPDEVWAEAGRIMRTDYKMVANEPDSLQALFAQIQGIPYDPNDHTAFRLIENVGETNIEWFAFQKLTKFIVQRKFVVAAGVTGAGATKQAKRSAILIAGAQERLLNINCAPQFDLDYHKKYIGYETEGQYMPGELLQFWEKCRQDPQHKYVALVDNMDKINPETFFGPELWESLSSPKDTAVLGKKTVPIPANFYLISVTHLGPGSLVEFNEEHFKRLGRQFIVQPNPTELLAWLKQQEKKLAQSTAPNDQKRLQALRDTFQIHRFLYYFLKTNAFITHKYGPGYELGQGSNIRPLYTEADIAEFKQTYINHINAFHTERPLKESDFDGMAYTVQTRGLEEGSNFFSRQIKFLQETGYLVEISMVAGTALLTALAGWWVFRRRERLIRHYGERTKEVYIMFEKQQISAEIAGRRLEEIKKEVDDLVLSRKLGYTEGLYFLAFIEDRAKRIEFARNVSENFLELFNAFMEDDYLSESEYLKLRQFLQSIRHKIPTDSYEQFHRKVEQSYLASKIEK